MITDDVYELYDNALDILRDAGWPRNELDDRQYLDAVSFLKLAIQKAGEPFPEANSVLARVYYFGDNYQDSWDEATKALSADPDEIRSQLNKVFILTDTVVVVKGGAFGSLGKFFKANSIGEGFQLGQEASEAAMSQRQLRREIEHLLEIYDRLCSRGIESNEYRYLSQNLITIADAIIEKKVPFARKINIYAHIKNVSLDRIEYDPDEDIEAEKAGVRKVRQLADGRSLAL